MKDFKDDEIDEIQKYKEIIKNSHRHPKDLMLQTENFFFNLGAVRGLSTILDIDPLFKKFIKDEIGIDINLIYQMRDAVTKITESLKEEMLTEEECKKFLDNETVPEGVVVN